MNLAPNGQPSNLTPEQYRLVRTPAFKKWFGDWENSPETASKVIDENGEPLVLFHGTYGNFNVFEKNNSFFGIGSYFTADFNYAKDFSDDSYDDNDTDDDVKTNKVKGKVLQVFLNLRNPYILDNTISTNRFFDDFKKNDSSTFEEQEYYQLLNNKYDGKIVSYGGIYKNTYIAFNSNQIKLADGTNTTFDSNNPDIRYDGGGLIKEVENENEGNLYYILNDNQVGYLDYYYDLNSSISEELNKFKSELYISYVEVDKKYRGKSVATKLIKKAIDIAKKMNIEVVSLRRDDGLGCNYGSNYDKYLKNIYEKLGFIENNKDCGMILNLKKQYKKYEDGGELTLTTEQVENKLDRKLHWWDDDVVSINGIEYKKVFLRPEYKRL